VTTESAETLPKTLPGVVCAQWRKCGKAGCRCARGTPHGPYFYRFWRHNGRLYKAYVRKTDVEDVRGRCQARPMALAQSGYFDWLEKLACRTSRDSVSPKKLDEEAPWMAPSMSDAEAVEQAAAMMDRFNKMFLRSLRALSDLRRHNRPVVVQNAGQVNVGGQQVNVSSG